MIQYQLIEQVGESMGKGKGSDSSFYLWLWIWVMSGSMPYLNFILQSMAVFVIDCKFLGHCKLRQKGERSPLSKMEKERRKRN